MFTLKNVCRNLFLWFTGKTAKIAEIRTCKNFVPDIILNKLIIIKMDYYYFCFVRIYDSLTTEG